MVQKNRNDGGSGLDGAFPEDREKALVWTWADEMGVLGVILRPAARFQSADKECDSKSYHW